MESQSCTRWDNIIYKGDFPFKRSKTVPLNINAVAVPEYMLEVNKLQTNC